MVRTPLILAPFCILAAYPIASAQEPSAVPRFEVASVKSCAEQAESRPGDRKGDGRESSPVRLHLGCQTLFSLIQSAYVFFADARFDGSALVPISGGPSWINTELFQIDAISDVPRNSGTMNGPMLRVLLEERFHLAIRRDSKIAAIYALTVAKGAVPKMPRANGNCITYDPEHPVQFEPGKPFPTVCGMLRTTDKGSDAAGVTMSRFAEILSGYADQKVVDRTGLSGEFDIHLGLSAYDLGRPPRNATDEDAKLARDPAQIFSRVQTAVQKLGLHIEATKGPTESLFVERVEKPSDN